MHARSLLATLLVASMAVIVMAGGCATGGDSAGPLPPVDASSESSSGSCDSPKIECGSACIDPRNDNSNCGRCMKACAKGLVCSEGKCGVTCSGSDTFCSGAPYDAGALDASIPETGSDATGPTEAGSLDGGDGGLEGGLEAGKADAGKHDAGGKADAGALEPYCANLTDDPKNCGACGRTCNPDETCDSGECVPHCKKGQTVCPGDTGCRGPGECCTTTDCTNIGETCPFPGGTCACQPDYTVCDTYSTCIPKGTCCTTAECKITGETCSSPGETCTCPSGQVACETSGMCIPMGNCCSDSDCKSVSGATCTGGMCVCPGGGTVCAGACIPAGMCCPVGCTPPPPEVETTTCVTATCTITTCDPGYVDVNGIYADGCECADDAYGKSCAAITDAGSVNIGGKVTETGVLPLASEQNWFQVDFPQYTLAGFAAQITISPATEFLFNVYTASCSSTALSCGDEGTKSTGLATWAMSETDTSSPIDTPPTVGTGGVVYVEVYRASGAPTCDSYTLTITD